MYYSWRRIFLLAASAAAEQHGCVGDNIIRPTCQTTAGICEDVVLDVKPNIRTRVGCDEKCLESDDCRW